MQLRSVNLERDLGEVSPGYVVTGRVTEVVQRILAGLRADIGTRAWAVTGPYGAGKSALGQFTAGLLSPKDSTAWGSARQLACTNAQLLADLLETRAETGVDVQGFLVGVATCRREPLANAVFRALTDGMSRSWTRLPKDIATAHNRALELRLDSSPEFAASVIELFAALSRRRSILLILDELGKGLENAASGDPRGDIFILQELAERAADPVGHRSALITLQHLSFGDYLATAPVSVRRELSKVQGRFEEVSYIPSRTDTLRLIERSLEGMTSGVPRSAHVARWVSRCLEVIQAESKLGKDLSERGAMACFPVHPLALAVLPELSSRYAQNERTLIGLLLSEERGSFKSALRVPEDLDAPIFGLSQLYEYFVESSGSIIAGSTDARRWFEIQRRLSETIDVSLDQSRTLKAVAVLNLAAGATGLRASRRLIEVAISQPGDGASLDVTEALQQLEHRGIITYRRVSDEYRVWWGTDFDVTDAVDQKASSLSEVPLGLALNEILSLPPVVAARYTQETGYLRFFQSVIASGDLAPIPDHVDGQVVYDFGPTTHIPPPVSPKPTILIELTTQTSLHQKALQALACRRIQLDHGPRLESDWVARTELQQREASLVSECVDELLAAIGNSGVEATAITESGIEAVSVAHGIAAAVSEVCARVYPLTPHVRNEMIARRELSSQGAKARRELIEAMILHPEDERLGIEGYGPERAMYEAVLAWTGIHRSRPDMGWSFGPPKRASPFVPIWREMNGFIDSAPGHMSAEKIHRRLEGPPFGLPPALVPVLLVAVLLARSDELAIYQDGTYQAAITPELTERMVKTPDRFSVRRIKYGSRNQEWLRAIQASAPTAPRTYRRNATVLGTLAPLLSSVRSLPDWSLHTRSLSAQAIAVRAALLRSVEPDQLLFTELPKALRGEPARRGMDVDGRGEMLKSAMDELQQAFPRLLSDIRADVISAFAVPPSGLLREDLRTRTLHLTSEILEPRIASFLWIAKDQALDDEDWVEALAMNIGERPPRAWRDEDRERFRINARQLGASFQRVEALHFEHRGGEEGEVTASRVTVTTPDGHEYARVVWLEPPSAAAIRHLSEEVINKATQLIGTNGVPALLAEMIAHIRDLERNETRSVTRSEEPRIDKVVDK